MRGTHVGAIRSPSPSATVNHQPFERSLTRHCEGNSLRIAKRLRRGKHNDHSPSRPFPVVVPVPTCISTYLGDGYCDETNNIAECSECCVPVQAVPYPIRKLMSRATPVVKHRLRGVCCTRSVLPGEPVRKEVIWCFGHKLLAVMHFGVAERDVLWGWGGSQGVSGLRTTVFYGQKCFSK